MTYNLFIPSPPYIFITSNLLFLNWLSPRLSYLGSRKPYISVFLTASFSFPSSSPLTPSYMNLLASDTVKSNGNPIKNGIEHLPLPRCPHLVRSRPHNPFHHRLKRIPKIRHKGSWVAGAGIHVSPSLASASRPGSVPIWWKNVSQPL